MALHAPSTGQDRVVPKPPSFRDSGVLGGLGLDRVGLSTRGSSATGQMAIWQAAVRMHGQRAEWADSHGHCHLHPEPVRQDDGGGGPQ